MRTRLLASSALLAAALLGGCVAAPPPRVVYVRPPPHCAWVPGHWRWTDDGYRIWVRGHCLPVD